MALKVIQFETATLLQGGADAFVQAVIATGIVPNQGVVWEIDRIETLFGEAQLSGLSADSSINWSLTRDSEAATTGFEENDCIYSDGLNNALTTSGEVVVRDLNVYTPPEGVFVWGANLYAQLDSTNTGLSVLAYMRIYYHEVKASELDILRMAQQGC